MAGTRSPVITCSGQGVMPHYKYGPRRSVKENVSSPRFISWENSNGQDMGCQLGALTTCAAVFVYVLLRRARKLPVIRDVPGPVNPSWIFGMFPMGQSGPFTSSRWSMTLSVETFKDTSGIFRSKKLEEWRGGSSRTSGTLFVSTVRLGYVPPFVEHTLVTRSRSPY